MGQIYIPPKIVRGIYGNVLATNKTIEEFTHLIAMNINEIIPFEQGTDDLLEQGRTILPRHYYLFIGTKDGELQLKPYEYDQYRIVVSTYNNVIQSIDSIG
jgi:hypothetical protein